MKVYHDVGYFPVMISKAFLVSSIYGEVDEKILTDSFLIYICEDKRETAQNLLAIDAKESFLKVKIRLTSWTGLSADLKLQSSIQKLS